MPYLIAVWFFVGSFVAKASVDDLKAERQTVTLFEQTNHGYRVYDVTVDK